MNDRLHEPLPPDALPETKIAILEERLRSTREGIDKQAREYERRLTELNHAHEKQVADQARYVSLDTYQGWQGEINAWKGIVSTELTLVKGQRSGASTVQGFIFQILPMLIAIASIFALVYVSSAKGHP